MEHSIYEEIRAYLIKIYAEANVANLQIVSLMGAIEYEINKIETEGLFSKRFNVSKNIRVVVYKNREIGVFVNLKKRFMFSNRFNKRGGQK